MIIRKQGDEFDKKAVPVLKPKTKKTSAADKIKKDSAIKAKAGARLETAKETVAGINIGKLITGLKSDDFSARYNAAFKLGELGPSADNELKKKIVFALIPVLLNDKEEAVRRKAAQALGNIGAAANDELKETIVTVLREALKKEEVDNVRVAIAMALVSIMPKPADKKIEKLIKDLDNKDPEVRLNAARELAEMKEAAKDAVPALIKLLEDPDGNVISTATYALGEIGESAVPELINALNSAESSVCEHILLILTKIGTKASAAVPAIMKKLNDADNQVRRAAAFALGDILLKAENSPQIKAAVSALIKMLKDESAVCRAAIMSLGKIGAAAAEAVPAITNKLSDEDTLYHAVEALGNIGPAAKDAVPKLIKLLANDSSFIVKAVMASLIKIGPDAIPELIKALNDEDKYIKLGAIYVLGEFGQSAKDAVPMLAKLLNDKDPEIQTMARVSLEKIKI